MFYLEDYVSDDDDFRKPDALHVATLIWLQDWNEDDESFPFKEKQLIEIKFHDDASEGILFNGNRRPYSLPLAHRDRESECGSYPRAYIWVDTTRDFLSDEALDALDYLDYESNFFARYTNKRLEQLFEDGLPMSDSYNLLETTETTVVKYVEIPDPSSYLARIARERATYLEVRRTRNGLMYATYRGNFQTHVCCFLPYPSDRILREFSGELDHLSNLGPITIAEEWDSFRSRFAERLEMEFPSECFMFTVDGVALDTYKLVSLYAEQKMESFSSTTLSEYLKEVLGGAHELVSKGVIDSSKARVGWT